MHYRCIDRLQKLDWVDISREQARVYAHGLTPALAMKRLHVLDVNGNWQTGVAGFIELWACLPYYRWLAALLTTLRMVGPLDFVYGYWARWRAKRRCSGGACEIP
jgi:hypothetical protein